MNYFQASKDIEKQADWADELMRWHQQNRAPSQHEPSDSQRQLLMQDDRMID